MKTVQNKDGLDDPMMWERLRWLQDCEEVKIQIKWLEETLQVS